MLPVFDAYVKMSFNQADKDFSGTLNMSVPPTSTLVAAANTQHRVVMRNVRCTEVCLR